MVAEHWIRRDSLNAWRLRKFRTQRSDLDDALLKDGAGSDGSYSRLGAGADRLATLDADLDVRLKQIAPIQFL